MADTSEEKSQPATDKKLRDARKKGQVAKSQDLVSGVVILLCTLCIAVLLPRARAQVEALIDLTANIYIEPFADVWPRLLDHAEQIVLGITLPVVAVTVAAVILTNIVTMRGVVFSVEPVKPDIKRIHPGEGFKRIFAMRNLIEFLKGLVKVLLLALAFYIVGRQALQALMESSRCGAGCIESTFYLVLKPLVFTVLAAFLLVGAVDVMMQRWLFGRDMKMSRSEQKRERKDVDGDPLIKRERQRQRREMQALATKLGLGRASLMIGIGGNWVVGVRYVRGETPVPVVVCRGSPEESVQLLAQAAPLGIAVWADAGLAEQIAKRSVAGDPVPENTFQAVADALVAHRLI
ncbi:EscU/YscU/HrcU family type III secretion system export apparatus switch protein [Pseudomonas viridiflava]|uniref:EscU/YscU/HrcU family type III secretion system export apparatus switch protein n=1 Tax=Pseudomonas viridiflava TaxID=33069 RepID=UPI000F04AABA|nr:EscU/YscU/HrcU family type III secretion system export apparatus switch protein [Pseudomonas viridiflava]MEE3915691.1 EscU/YscU/HrcU family type III secretion system export apparatus switch protein [Pseudomonas viridiflava]MEE3974560.1 EscU/YscU/HrcU family type III secretion system export apparatus switch protein [Pseudomonas viridiflava]MEE4019387.1 EscU/YscU/HrcU family type III secretion system export apparatus switch protein [Pseudomonas viridiflava]MEE4044522.1 EscU/YscU/HrcU family ty